MPTFWNDGQTLIIQATEIYLLRKPFTVLSVLNSWGASKIFPSTQQTRKSEESQ